MRTCPEYARCFAGILVREVIPMDDTKRRPRRQRRQPDASERPVPPEIYPVIDTDLARDNIENDLPAADLNEL